MKPTAILWCIVALVSVATAQPSASPSPPPPKFVGYLAIGANKWFALAAPTPEGKEENQSWRKIGQRIGDFEIASFDSKSESLTLKGADGKATVIKLSVGKAVASDDSEAQMQRILRQLANSSIRDLPNQAQY